MIHAECGYLSRWENHPEKSTTEIRYKKLTKLIKTASKALHADFIIEGWENYQGNVNTLYTPNHMSFFDPVTLLSIIPDPVTFVAKTEVESFPVIGKAIHYLNGLFMDRSDMKGSLKVMMEVQKRLENGDQSWFIYPEGTRMKDQMCLLDEFHHGTFRAAMKAHAPIVPVATYGTFRPLKLKPQYKKYPVFVKFLKPLTYEDYKDMTSEEVAKYVQDEVQRCISFELRAKDNEYMSKIDKKYRFNYVY